VPTRETSVDGHITWLSHDYSPWPSGTAPSSLEPASAAIEAHLLVDEQVSALPTIHPKLRLGISRVRVHHPPSCLFNDKSRYLGGFRNHHQAGGSPLSYVLNEHFWSRSRSRYCDRDSLFAPGGCIQRCFSFCTVLRRGSLCRFPRITNIWRCSEVSSH
jgi:hypothetical protein